MCHIYIDAHNLDDFPAGKARYTSSIIQALADTDFRVTLLVTAPNRQLRKQFPSINQVIHPHTRPLKPKPNQHSLLISPLSYIPTILTSIPVITVVYDLISTTSQSFRTNSKARIIESVCIHPIIHKSAAILSISDTVTQQICSKWNQVKPKTFTLNPCVYPHHRESPIPLIRKPYFLCIGTLEPRKNYPNITKAFSLFKQDHPQYTLLIIGKSGWHNSQIIQEIQSTSGVVWRGYVSDSQKQWALKRATALIYVPFAEGYGLPIAEAQFAKLPAIVSSSPPMSTIAPLSTIPVDPLDPVQLSAAMSLLIHSEIQFKLRQSTDLYKKQHDSSRFQHKLISVIDFVRKQT